MREFGVTGSEGGNLGDQGQNAAGGSVEDQAMTEAMRAMAEIRERQQDAASRNELFGVQVGVVGEGDPRYDSWWPPKTGGDEPDDGQSLEDAWYVGPDGQPRLRD